jgi:hypothetical protein
MKRAISAFILITITVSANCDVIFFPKQYTVFSYSVELIYNSETLHKPKYTTCFWGGIGCVGSIYYIDEPTYGIEIAFEIRHYFKPDNFKHSFISGYIGAAYMTDFKSSYDIGIIPGFKINYKAHISPKTIIEPYISLSTPICYNIVDESGYVPFPTITVGARFGFSYIINKIKSKT